MKKLFAVLMVLIALPALAQFKADVSGGAGDTKLTISNKAPGAADLSFVGVKLVYLNGKALPGVKTMKDASGKGTVQVVDVATSGLGSADLCLSGVGRGGYAVKGGKVDPGLSVCVPLADNVTVPITAEDGVIGFTMVAAQSGTVVPGVYPSHPRASRLVKNANGATDMVLLLSVKGGVVSLANDAEVAEYAKVYKAVTAQ